MLVSILTDIVSVEPWALKLTSVLRTFKAKQANLNGFNHTSYIRYPTHPHLIQIKESSQMQLTMIRIRTKMAFIHISD